MSEQDSLLKRPLSSLLRLDGWLLLALLILLAATATRLWDLGSRSYNHDEAIHAWESWRLYTGQGYVHDPPYHGPFLYHATAFIFFLFGDSDYTGRLSAAMFSILTIGCILCLRRWLGRRGSLLTAGLAVISPALLYYGRFIRHDAFSLLFTLLMLLGILNYLEEPRDRYLYLLVLGQALYFCNMETAFIQTFVFWIFLAGLLLYQWRRDPATPWTKFPAFDLLMIMGTLVAPLASPLAIKALGALLGDPLFNPVDYSPAALLHSGLVWALFLAASAGAGLRWDRRRWLTAAGLFYGLYALLFTTFFTNAQGLVTGQLGSLGYWLSQQEVQRGGQPWHYYLALLPLYEYLPLVFGGGGAIYYLSRRARAAGPPGVSAPKAPFVPLLIFWAVLNLLVYSCAGEKMPWLSVHLALPLILLAGWFGGRLLAADWRALARRGAAGVALLLPLSLVGLGGTWAAPPFTGSSTDAVSATLNWLAAMALLLMASLPLVNRIGHLGWRRALRVASVELFIFLALCTAHHSIMAVYKNGDVAVEMLVYAQATPDGPLVVRELEALSRRLGGDKALTVLQDSDTNWPFVWYFREWPNVTTFDQAPDGPVDAAVVIVSTDNEAGVKPFLGDRYYRRQYRLIWWPLEDYQTLTPARIWQNLANPEMRRSLWKIVLHRDYGVAPSAWPPPYATHFALYVRKDIASQLWRY
jgi:uncharacterized protein (TIGR03663 family)